MSDRHGWGRRALLEAPIIVGSILLAFAIDAGWDVRGEGVSRREVLEGLREEYEGHRTVYAGHLALAEERLSDIGRLLTGPSALDEGLETIQMSLFQLLTVNTVDPGRGVRDALVSSGKLELLGTVELRIRLAEWEGVVEELRDKQLVMRELVASQIVPYLAERGVPLTEVLSLGGRRHPQWPETLEWPTSPTASRAPLATYRSMLADPKFQSFVSVRYLWLVWSQYQLRAIASEIDWTLREVERALAS